MFLPSDVPKKTDCSRFKAVSDARAADVVVVKDLAAGLYTPESLGGPSLWIACSWP